MDIPNGETVCPECDNKTFTQTDTLRKHLRQFHGKEVLRGKQGRPPVSRIAQDTHKTVAKRKYHPSISKGNEPDSGASSKRGHHASLSDSVDRTNEDACVPVFATFPARGRPIKTSDYTAIQFDHEADKRLNRHQWYDLKKVAAWQKELGDDYVQRGGKASIWLHQNIVTLQMLQEKISAPVEMLSWKSLGDELRIPCKILPYLLDRKPIVVLLALSATVQEIPHGQTSLSEAYQRIAYLNSIFGGVMQAYPTEAEMRQEKYKVGDVQKLNEIAKCSRRFDYAYRPKSCLGVGPCVLSDHNKTVFKRSFSGHSQHVELRERHERHGLTCTTQSTPTKTRKSSKSSRERNGTEEDPADSCIPSFHQQYVSTFKSFGEFRILIATYPDPTGLRNLRGRVVCAIRSSLNDDGFLDGEVAQYILKQPDVEGWTSDLVYKFALYVHDQLRRSAPLEQYGSLETGVRLDVGVSEEREGRRPFVNEITRWYNGDWGTTYGLAEPKTQACESFAAALLHGLKRDRAVNREGTTTELERTDEVVYYGMADKTRVERRATVEERVKVENTVTVRQREHKSKGQEQRQVPKRDD